MDLKKARGTTYYSFKDFAEAISGKPVVLHTTNEEKLLAQQTKILGICPSCKEKLSYHGGNVLTCTNNQCKGVEYTVKDKETGEDIIKHRPYYRLLSTKDGEFARRIFS